MIYGHSCYRSFLKETLSQRIQSNPAYSLRALSRDLGLSPSTLCEVLKGSKSFSFEKSLEVARRLKLPQKEADYFASLVQYASAKQPESRAEILKKLNQQNRRSARVHDLGVDTFTAMAEWYHIPILVMTDLAGFSLSPIPVARRLGITPLEAEVAIDRLLRLGLLERDARGKLRRAHESSIFKSDAAHSGLRQFHRQMLGKAAESLEAQTNSEKFVGSQTFAIGQDRFPEACRRIREFLTEMEQTLEKGSGRDRVYHLGVQFFRLTKGKRS